MVDVKLRLNSALASINDYYFPSRVSYVGDRKFFMRYGRHVVGTKDYAVYETDVIVHEDEFVTIDFMKKLLMFITRYEKPESLETFGIEFLDIKYFFIHNIYPISNISKNLQKVPLVRTDQQVSRVLDCRGNLLSAALRQKDTSFGYEITAIYPNEEHEVTTFYPINQTFLSKNVMYMLLSFFMDVEQNTGSLKTLLNTYVRNINATASS